MGYSNRTWVCPFYKWDERLCVHCEGGKIRFPDRISLNEFVRLYCGTANWKTCSVAENLLRYYERIT